MKNQCGALFVVVCASLFMSNAVGQPRPEFLQPSAQWTGVFKNEGPRSALPEGNLIAEEESWAKLWKAWRPEEELPEVDFAESIVYVGTAPGPNRTLFSASRAADGELRITLGGTKIGGPGFGYVLAVLPREGLETYQGKPLPPAAEAGEYVRVEVRGKVSTGLVAIGGETTGAAIKADGITFELDFGGNETLATAAEQADGKVAKVRGRLERRAGVELKQRWILHVRSLQPAERQ